jgi:hypothetical protein
MTTRNNASRRGSSRSKVLLAAKLQLPDRTQAVRLRDLSASGALVEGAGDLIVDGPVIFCRNDLAVAGVVAWSNGKHAGICFSRPLSPDVVLRHIPRPAERKVVDHKRPALKRRGLSAQERLWMDQLAASGRTAPGGD